MTVELLRSTEVVTRVSDFVDREVGLILPRAYSEQHARFGTPPQGSSLTPSSRFNSGAWGIRYVAVLIFGQRGALSIP
eukprot:5194495-Pleurochrysis_carterae.AAC.3